VLGSFDGGHLAMVTISADAAGSPDGRVACRPRCRERRCSLRAVVGIHADTLGEALGRRRRLTAGQSWLPATACGWAPIGCGCRAIRTHHTGVIEREESLRDIGAQVSRSGRRSQGVRIRLELRASWCASTRTAASGFKPTSNRCIGNMSTGARRWMPPKHGPRMPHGAWGRSKRDWRTCGLTLTRTESDLRAARARMEIAIESLAALEPKRSVLEQERERLRSEQAAARTTAQAVQTAARELAVRVESRRTAHATTTTTLERVQKQLEGLAMRRDVTGRAARGWRGAARGAAG